MVSCEIIFSSILIITVGLLFIDLVPLQETMRCSNYSSPECPDLFYSSSYQDAREKFLAAAEVAHAAIQNHLILKRGNVEYYMDTAFFKGKNPNKLLVHASGTHGVEGYTGSAIQTKLLREWNESATDGPSILFIHAVNPYGMTHFRRFNEENVDLNRNYHSSAEWKEMLKRDENVAGYEDLREFMAPTEAPRIIDRYMFFYHVLRAALQHGIAAVKRAFVTGQYHHPEGIYYGGAGEQKSVTVLREILRHHASSGLDEAIFVDVHTGLGPSGVDTFMVSNEKDEERSKSVFSGSRVQCDATASSGPSGGYDLAKGIIRPVAELGPNTLAVTEEFGTVSPVFVARAVILENAAYHHCNGSYVHEVMRTWMRDAFYPQDINYKKSTLQKGQQAFWSALHHLSSSE